MYFFGGRPVVAIAQKAGSEGFKPAAFVEQFEPLAAELDCIGVDTIGLDGRADNIEGTAQFSRYFEFSSRNKTGLQEKIAEVTVAAAYDRTGGIARFVPSVPALNPGEVRNIVASKARQHEVLGSLRHAMPEFRIAKATEDSLTAAIDELDAATIIVKPDKDPDKKLPFLMGTKDEIARDLWKLLLAADPNGNFVLQEFMPEIHAGFHPELEFYDGEEQNIQAAAHLARELRIHVIDEYIVAAHGRVGLDGIDRSRDTWVFFEQQSLPLAVVDLVMKGTKLIRQNAKANNSYLAWDVTPDGTRVVEVNGRSIGIMRPDPYRFGAQEVHTRIKRILAEKLAVMASHSAF